AVPLQAANLLARRRVPEVGGAVHAGAGQRLAVRREGQAVDTLFRPVNRQLLLAGCAIPQANGLVPAAGGQESAGRRIRDPGKRGAVAKPDAAEAEQRTRRQGIAEGVWALLLWILHQDRRILLLHGRRRSLGGRRGAQCGPPGGANRD